MICNQNTTTRAIKNPPTLEITGLAGLLLLFPLDGCDDLLNFKTPTKKNAPP